MVHVRALAIAAMTSVLVGTLDAQPTRRPRRADTPVLTVQVFRSADRIAGPAASDALRDRLIQVYPGPVLWVMEKPVMVDLLTQSGYPTNEQLARTDENQLAKYMRADEYVRGQVVRAEDGQWRAEAQLVLTRDLTLTQTLPPAVGRRPEAAAVGLVRSIQDARRQLTHEKRCVDHARNRRFAQAIAEADEAIADYPNATLVRYCKLEVLVAQEAPNADIIKVSDEILAIDPNNRRALAAGAKAYEAEGNVDHANEMLVRLLTNDPTNAALANQVIDKLAFTRKYDLAKEIVDKAVVDNPGDASLMSLKFRIYAAMGEYKGALQAGEEMVALDTTLKDAQFFLRMNALYAADSQPAQSLQIIKEGTEKFDNNADIWQRYAQTLRLNGQLLESIEATKRALAINPNIEGAWMSIVNAYNDMGLTDSAISALNSAQAAGESPDRVAGMLATLGNRLRDRGNAEKNVTTLRTAFSVLARADTVSQISSPEELKTQIKFLLGYTGVLFFQHGAPEAAATKSCEFSRELQDKLNVASFAITAGARFQPQAASQILQTLPDWTNYANQLVTASCR